MRFLVSMKRLAALVLPIALAALALTGCGGGESKSSTAGQATSKRGGAPSGQDGTSQQRSSAYNQYLLPFGADPLSTAQRTALVKHGEIRLPVRVRKAGTLSATGQAQPSLSILKVARAAPVIATGPGVFVLKLRLTPVARKILAHGHSILMYLAIFFSRSRTAQQLTVPLHG